MNETRRFQKINEDFICEHCGRSVPPAEKTCRNHCPFCLHSKHLDICPGDRAHDCKGLLKPIAYEKSAKGWMIRFQCTRCRESPRTIALLDDAIQPDNYEVMLRLTPNL